VRHFWIFQMCRAEVAQGGAMPRRINKLALSISVCRWLGVSLTAMLEHRSRNRNFEMAHCEANS
jgi:hypothetical protein